MPVKTLDGLAHVTARHEDAGRWGSTVCGISYTRDPAYLKYIQSDDGPIKPVKFVKLPVTCIVCLAESSAP